MNKNYNILGADIINTQLVSDGALGQKINGTSCHFLYVQVLANRVTKQLDGSSNHNRKSIQFLAYSGICKLLHADTLAKIDGYTYGNLEVEPIVGTKLKVMITGYV
jgi:hypothetical protein